MLDIHIQNVEHLQIGNITGTAVFSQLIGDYRGIFPLVRRLIIKEISNTNIELSPPGKSIYADFIRECCEDEKNKMK